MVWEKFKNCIVLVNNKTSTTSSAKKKKTKQGIYGCFDESCTYFIRMKIIERKFFYCFLFDSIFLMCTVTLSVTSILQSAASVPFFLNKEQECFEHSRYLMTSATSCTWEMLPPICDASFCFQQAQTVGSCRIHLLDREDAAACLGPQGLLWGF